MIQYSFVTLGSGSKSQLPVNHTIMKVNNQDTYNHSVTIQPFRLSLSVQYSINYMKYSTFIIK